MNFTVLRLLRANVIKSELFIRSHRSQWEFGWMPLGNTDALHRAGGRSTNCVSSGVFSSYSKWNTAQHHRVTPSTLSLHWDWNICWRRTCPHRHSNNTKVMNVWIYSGIKILNCIIIINIIAIPCYWSTKQWYHCLP